MFSVPIMIVVVRLGSSSLGGDYVITSKQRPHYAG